MSTSALNTACRVVSDLSAAESTSDSTIPASRNVRRFTGRPCTLTKAADFQMWNYRFQGTMLEPQYPKIHCSCYLLSESGLLAPERKASAKTTFSSHMCEVSHAYLVLTRMSMYGAIVTVVQYCAYYRDCAMGVFVHSGTSISTFNHSTV